ncbi:MAG: orc1/cdc6 family replication initiation protein [Candidatus Lokiarchaeota archaeon]|nr:orc1/cdc6 family replication initiation protein [Candidatus Lokiarchaeota archaeon]
MIAKQMQYVGPRAIFDPNFVPPKLLYRKKEEVSIYSMLRDSLSDNYNMNMLFQGIDGIGKKVLVQKVVRDLISKVEDVTSVSKFCVDCREKTFEDVLISMLSQILKKLDLSLEMNAVLNSTPSRLWTLYKLACKKLGRTSLVILNNIEYLKPEKYKKFLSSAKEINVSLISTVNRILRPSTIDLLPEFDFKKKLRFFSYKELNSILRQRARLTFAKEIDRDVIDFIADVTFEHHIPVPGKGIEVFRECYPLLKSNSTIDLNEMLDVCKNQFDSFRMSDDFGVLSYLAEEDLLTIIFLDNLSNHFLKKAKFYVSSTELRELYDISCESLEYRKNTPEYDSLIHKFVNVGILSLSRKPRISPNYSFKTRNAVDNDSYFMIICPHQLKSIVDVIFGKL